tara:strand:- start:8382 stop:9509 length:1128 start_codon:yes stop_codon:yes gene_type:complete
MKVCFVIYRFDFFASHRLDLAVSLAQTHEVFIITDCLNAPEEEVKRIHALGVSVHHLASRSGSLNLISYSKYFLSLKNIIHKIKPNFLFYVTLEMSAFGALLHNFISPKKSFFLITGLEPFFFNRKFKYILYRAIQKILFLLLRLRSNYKFIFQNSDDMKTFINKKLVTRNHASIIPGSGIDMNHFSFQQRNTSNKIIFLFASRLIRSKGIIEYFEASRDLALKYPDIEFHIAGSFDLTNPDSITQSEFNELQSNNAIRYLGSLTFQEMKGCLDAASILVLPSYGEGLPKIALEAAASGMPLIMTNTTGSRDCVVEGENGFLVNAHSPSHLMSAMEKFILKRDLVSTFGKNSFLLVKEHFSIKLISQEYLKLIEE